MAHHFSNIDRRHVAVIALLLFAQAHAQRCAAGLMPQPFPAQLIGRSFRANNCARDQQWSEVRLDAWGVTVVSALRRAGLAGAPLYACDEQTTVAYAKNDRTDAVYFRPFAPPTFFKGKLPEREYLRLFNSRGGASWPCHLVPVQKLLPWGPTRRKFVDALRGTLRTAIRTRTAVYNGCDGYFMGKPASMRLAEIEKLRKNERIISAAVNHISNVAYRNFLCSSFYRPYQDTAL